MIYIVTPCSRPENLEAIYNSIVANIPPDKIMYYEWFIIFDSAIPIEKSKYFSIVESFNIITTILFTTTANALAGHAHRNSFLDIFFSTTEKKITPFNWVYFLDDDTLLHPNFDNFVFPELLPDRTAIIFNQSFKDGSPRLYAAHSNIKVCHIDMGQYVLNLNLLPETLKFKEDDYCADGIFIEELYNTTENKNSFQIVNQFCSIYNALRD